MVGATAASTHLVSVEKYFRCGWWAPSEVLAPVQAGKPICDTSHSPLTADDHIIGFARRACILWRIFVKLASCSDRDEGRPVIFPARRKNAAIMPTNVLKQKHLFLSPVCCRCGCCCQLLFSDFLRSDRDRKKVIKHFFGVLLRWKRRSFECLFTASVDCCALALQSAANTSVMSLQLAD